MAWVEPHTFIHQRHPHSSIAERKNLPAFIALGLVLIVVAAVALDYRGYVKSAMYTEVNAQIIGFAPANSKTYFRFKYTNPRGVRVTVLETLYSVMLNGVALTTDTIAGPIAVEGETPQIVKRPLTLPPTSGTHIQTARTGRVWEWEFKGAMRIEIMLGENRIDFSETYKYVPLFPP